VGERAEGRATLATPVEASGIGLHSGKPVQLRVGPAPLGSGVVFGVGAGEVPARLESVVDARNATSLGHDGARVTTVEHLLAALAMRGLDDALVELDASEPPAFDGSAAPFLALLERAGRRGQGGSRPVVRILEEVAVRDGEREISIAPGPGLGVDYEIDFAAPAIGRQSLSFPRLDAATFREQIAPARTFGFLEDVERLRSAGLASGASLANTVVVDGARVLNDEGLRWPDEFVRHKILDLLGDFALFGAPVIGHLRVCRGGHALHHALLRALHARPSAWQLLDAAPA